MGHSKRSPSSSARWLLCPGSVAAIDADIEAGIIVVKKNDDGGPHALWGTRCHLVGELLLLNKPYEEIVKQVPQVKDDEEMLDTAIEYHDYVMALMRPGSKLFVEKRVSLEQWIPSDPEEKEDSGGTADAIIIHTDNSMDVCDLKGGKGVAVDVRGNTQLKLYAAGAVSDFSMIYDIRKVRYHVIQPRREIFEHEETSAVALEIFMEYCEDQIQKDYLEAGEKQCQWCPRSGYCEAQAEMLKGGVFKADTLDFEDSKELVVSDPAELTLAQLTKIKQHAPAITKLLKAVDQRILERLHKGQKVTGFKLVEGRSNRKWDDTIDQDDLVDFMVEELDLDEDQVLIEKIATITEVEKMIDKKGKEALAKYIVKPSGKATIAPMADKRPALQNLEDDVAMLNEEE